MGKKISNMFDYGKSPVIVFQRGKLTYFESFRIVSLVSKSILLFFGNKFVGFA